MKKYFNTSMTVYVFKWMVFFIFVYVVYFYFYKTSALELLKANSHVFFEKKNIYKIIIVLIMSVLILLVEALKWRIALRNEEKMSLMRSFKAVCAGFTFALFTPNRIGDYAGRILFLSQCEKLKGIALTLVCSFAQLCVLFILGLSAYAFYMLDQMENVGMYKYLIPISVLLIIGLILIMYFKSSSILHFKIFNPIRKHLSKYLESIENIGQRDLAHLLNLSILKYFIASLQWFVLLTIFGMNISIIKCFYVVMLIFFSQAFIPSFLISEIGVRGSLSLHFWQNYLPSVNGVVLISSFIWLVNLILPALLGGLFLLQIKWNLFTKKSK